MKKIILICFLIMSTSIYAKGYVEINGPSVLIEFDDPVINSNLPVAPPLYDYNVSVIQELGFEAITIWASTPVTTWTCTVTNSDPQFFIFKDNINMFGPGSTLISEQVNGVCTFVITFPNIPASNLCPPPVDCPMPGDCGPVPAPICSVNGSCNVTPCPLPDCTIPGACTNPSPLPIPPLQPGPDCSIPGGCVTPGSLPTPPVM